MTGAVVAWALCSGARPDEPLTVDASWHAVMDRRERYADIPNALIRGLVFDGTEAHAPTPAGASVWARCSALGDQLHTHQEAVALRTFLARSDRGGSKSMNAEPRQVIREMLEALRKVNLIP